MLHSQLNNYGGENFFVWYHKSITTHQIEAYFIMNGQLPSNPDEVELPETRIVRSEKAKQEEEEEALSCMTDAPNKTMVINFQQNQDKFKDCYKIYAFGPIVINTDGTLGRVSNWSTMTETEQASAFRLLCARNKRRVEALRAAYQSTSGIGADESVDVSAALNDTISK